MLFEVNVGIFCILNEFFCLKNIIQNYLRQKSVLKELFLIIPLHFDEKKIEEELTNNNITVNIFKINENWNSLQFILSNRIKKLNINIISIFNEKYLYEDDYILKKIKAMIDYDFNSFILSLDVFYKIICEYKKLGNWTNSLSFSLSHDINKINYSNNNIKKIEMLMNKIQNNNYINLCEAHFIKYENSVKYGLENYYLVDVSKCKIAIIMTCYNSAEHIKISIDSILKQTHKNFVLYIVDDCSNDKTVSIINNIKDERIIVIQNQNNRGTYYCKNLALTEIEKNIKQFDFIGLQDSDDTSHPERIRKQIEILKITGGKLCTVLCEKNKYLRLPMVSKVFHIDVFKTLGFFDINRFGADSEFYYRFFHYYGIKITGSIQYKSKGTYFKNIEGLYYNIPIVLYNICNDGGLTITHKKDEREIYKNSFINKIININNISELRYEPKL